MAISVSTRGSIPAPPAAATSAAPARPPKLQPACSEDMIGRCRMRSTATPWAFIETSIAPLDAPSTISASGSSHGSGASSGSGSTSAQTMPGQPGGAHAAEPHDRLAHDRQGDDHADRHRRG